MPTWIARQIFHRESKELRSYISTEGTKAVYWTARYPYKQDLGEVVDEASTERIKELAQTGLCAHEVERAELETGQCYSRIWRPERYSFSPLGEGEADRELVLAIQAADLLLDKVRQIFRTVQPTKDNRLCYGHEIRALLILACTEVESAWKAILQANTFPESKEAARWSTKDYVKLASPLRLREWAVAMPLFLDYGPIAPFSTWKPEEPTKSLPWYSAYNASKHDREGAFSEATLEHLIEATAAVFVLMAAQVGPDVLSAGHYAIKGFAIARQPAWHLGEEYVPPIDFRQQTGSPTLQIRAWMPVAYPFGKSNT